MAQTGYMDERIVEFVDRIMEKLSCYVRKDKEELLKIVREMMHECRLRLDHMYRCSEERIIDNIILRVSLDYYSRGSSVGKAWFVSAYPLSITGEPMYDKEVRVIIGV